MRRHLWNSLAAYITSTLLLGTLAAAQSDAASPDVGAQAASAPQTQAVSAPNSASHKISAPELKVRPAHFLPTKNDEVIWAMHDHVPLGTESVMLPNGNHRATLLASAESPALDGILVFTHKGVKHIVHSDGSPVTTLPAHITFRISATGALTLKEAAVPIDTQYGLQQFVDGLTFVAKVFRSDMDEHTYTPVAVKQVGIPLSVPSQTRIYRASFDFGSLSVNDRVVLLVNTTKGDPVAKFFLQLN